MKGKLVLGGGNKEKLFENISFFNNLKSLLYIPLAKKDENQIYAFKNIKKILNKYNFLNIELFSSSKDIDFNEFNCIYIEGGLTFKLLEEIRNLDLKDKILDYLNTGGSVIANSAGAIIFGFDINLVLFCSQKDFNYLNIIDTKGFNLLNNFDLQPHYLETQNQIHQNYSSKSKRNIIGIPESSGIIFENNKFKVIGEDFIYLIKKESIEKIKSGEYFDFK